MENERLAPDAILKALQAEYKDKSKGRLKIFFGYAAGVGKTYAMLKAAHEAKEKGIDVICGYIEPHARPKTSKLLEGLEVLPLKTVVTGGITQNEFDLDIAIKRHPELILVDELAHTNASGCRHTKRYQDIKELLEAGIDVYTTVNVQHIESLNDQVAAITGIFVRERIPDYVFDNADWVELVDIEPGDLIERLNTGNVYKEEQAKRAINNFFNIDNLTALREIALRRCADRVNILTENARIKNNADYHTDEHILVGLSSAPSNAKIIRTAARMAKAFRGSFTALFVEAPQNMNMNEADKKRLHENIHLAQQLGAKIETVYGDDIPYQIAEFARLSGVSKIVIGRSASKRRGLFNKASFTDKVIEQAPSLDVYVIPDADSSLPPYHKSYGKRTQRLIFSPLDIIKCILVLMCATFVGLIFEKLQLNITNIVSVYILGVLISAVITKHQVYSVIASFASVMTFNFFFTEPKYTFAVHDASYPVTFVIMFAVGMISSSLAIKLKQNAKLSAQAAYRTKVMFDTSQLLQQAKLPNQIISVTAKQLNKLLNTDIIVYPADEEFLLEPMVFPIDNHQLESSYTNDNERAVADWVMKNNKHAGATTNTLANAKCRYLAIRAGDRVYGVVGIVLEEVPLDAFENSILLSILGECALALENEKNARQKEEAAIIAKNEQLRSNLLRAISHDLRTPLTSISGNASNLMSNWKNFSDETINQLFGDIYDDSMWLINLVENLLSVTRLEDGTVKLHRSVELLEDIIEEAFKHLNRNSNLHNIEVDIKEELLLVNVDAKLIVQLIINLIDNAIKYTQENSTIIITAKKDDNQVLVQVIDNGPGIPDDRKSKVFDMFYSGANQIADSRRSLGLGLSLCKSIVTAHGKNIWITDNIPRGACFNFTLPAGEVEIHE